MYDCAGATNLTRQEHSASLGSCECVLVDSNHQFLAKDPLDEVFVLAVDPSDPALPVDYRERAPSLY
jgi:hypothetical protein